MSEEREKRPRSYTKKTRRRAAQKKERYFPAVKSIASSYFDRTWRARSATHGNRRLFSIHAAKSFRCGVT
jgi:hypothetical protein